MKQEYEFKVCTYCTTYNHAPYIVDAMNGFVMQKTTFPFVAIINDDASTDGEPDIIRNYLSDHFCEPFRKEDTDEYSLICAKHRQNQNCFFVVFLLKYNHYSIKKDFYSYWTEWLDNSKYHAVCEGDDCWIRPEKLQLQCDFLDTHVDYSMCCHNAVVWNVASERVDNFSSIEEGELSSSTVISKWCAPTASLLYRKELTAYPEWLVKIYSGDLALILRCLNAGRVFYFDRLMSIYRKNSSVSSMSAKMGDDCFIFVLEQHILLLSSFDEGTNYRFHNDIIKTVREKKQIISYTKTSWIGRLIEPYFYKLIARRIRRMIKA